MLLELPWFVFVLGRDARLCSSVAELALVFSCLFFTFFFFPADEAVFFFELFFRREIFFVPGPVAKPSCCFFRFLFVNRIYPAAMQYLLLWIFSLEGIRQ